MKPSEMRAEAKRLLAEADRIERDCIHKWGNTVSDPEAVSEPVYSHMTPRGSDPEFHYNWVTRYNPRWSRACIFCGKKEYTKEQRSTQSEPYFGDKR